MKMEKGDKHFLILKVYGSLPITTLHCTTIHRYPIFSTRYSVMCKVYTRYHGTSEIEHGLCACRVDNPLAKAQRLSLHTNHALSLMCNPPSPYDLCVGGILNQTSLTHSISKETK